MLAISEKTHTPKEKLTPPNVNLLREIFLPIGLNIRATIVKINLFFNVQATIFGPLNMD